MKPSRAYDDPDVIRGLQLHCDLAEKHPAEVNSIMERHYRAAPAFAPLLAGLSGEALAQQNAQNVARLRAAAYDDQWQPYLEGLRARGVAYARAGVSFVDWTEVFQLALQSFLDLWFQKVGEDPQKMRLIVKGVTAFFDTIVQTVGETFFVTQRERLQQEQELVRSLATPVLEVERGLLLAPLVGDVTDARMKQLGERVLAAVRAHKPKTVILDLTGVADVDTAVAGHLQRLAEAVRLLGARVWLSGLSVDVCESMVMLGIDLQGVQVAGTLAQAVSTARAGAARP